MLHLLRDFVASAHNVDTRPVLMLRPHVNGWRNGRADPAYGRFLTQDLLPESLNMTIIDLSELAFDEEKFTVEGWSGQIREWFENWTSLGWFCQGE